MLANDGVPQAVVDGFLASTGHLGDRLIAAMRAGLAGWWRSRAAPFRGHADGRQSSLARGRTAL